MGDNTGGARDRDKAEKRVEQVTTGAPPGREAEITENVYRNIEQDARTSEQRLEDAIRRSSKKGQDVSYYKAQEKDMIDAIQSNPNLTNYQKITQIQNIKAASDPMAVRSGYSLGERLAGAGSLSRRKMGENTPLTEADIAMMPPEMQDRAKYIAATYQRAPVLINGQIVAMPPTMPQVMGDIGRATGDIASGIMKATPTGAAINFLTDMYGKITGAEPRPEPEPKPELDYRDFLGRERTLDSEYGFSPLKSLTGIETLSNAPMMYDFPGMPTQSGGMNQVAVSSVPPTQEEVAAVQEEIPFLGGGEGGNITYPYGDVLVSYEDIINNNPVLSSSRVNDSGFVDLMPQINISGDEYRELMKSRGIG